MGQRISTRNLNHRFNLRGGISFLNLYLDSVMIQYAEDDAFSPSSTGIRRIRKSQLYLITCLKFYEDTKCGVTGSVPYSLKAFTYSKKLAL